MKAARKFMQLLAVIALLVITPYATAENKEPDKKKSLVERLGFPPNARVLIINGDDFGMNHATNVGTFMSIDGYDDVYIKIRLAPFGETIPFEHVLPFLRKIDVQGGHHYRGKEYVVYKNAPQPLSFLICYESIFPHKGKFNTILCER